MLDALSPSPAVIRTATWDVVAWNSGRDRHADGLRRACRRSQRNILRFIFLDPRVRAAHYDWASVARFVVGAFRVDAARAGAATAVQPFVDELCRLSPEFAAMWRDNDVLAATAKASSTSRHPILGPISVLEYSAFAVDGRPDLSMVADN